VRQTARCIRVSSSHRLAVAISVPRNRAGAEHRLIRPCHFTIRLRPRVLGRSVF
jgi:hypothetical protein